MCRPIKLTAIAIAAAAVLSACSSGNTDGTTDDSTQPSTQHSRVQTTIGSAVKFTCPKTGKGKPELSYYLANKPTDADVKFGTELTVGNVSVTQSGCTWGYDYRPDKASAKALSDFPESVVIPRPDYVAYQNDGDAYEAKRTSPLDSVQTERGTTIWMLLEAPATNRGVPIDVSCLSDITGMLSCVKNWPQIEKGLHKITQQP